MKKRIISLVCLSAIVVVANAQSGTNSPYSQYGIGILSDQSLGFNRGMNGVGLGIRKGNIVNTLNPASYSAVDSLTMMFDVGLSGQVTNFEESGMKVNANNSNFEYAVGSFRLFPSVGVSFGILPYSNIGYNYYSEQKLSTSQQTITDTHTGEGGIHQAFIGAGWRIVKPLSVGVNVAYLWGTYNRSISSSSTTSINSLAKNYYGTINNYNIELGIQWQQHLSKKDELTLGATVGIGHKLGCDANCEILDVNSQTGECDTTLFSIKNGLEIPMTYGVGLAWNHSNRWLIAADFAMQQWGSVKYPYYDGNIKNYILRDDLLMDRYKVNVGADFVPQPTSRHFLNRVHYRFGAGYTTPYYKINGVDGPKEYSVSAGFGIPLQNAYNNRSILNISAQWAHTSAKDLITENTFRINIGLTFNERWFMKWRID